MTQPVHSLMLSSERDVVNARQRARTIAEALGFDHNDQIRIATAVSEIARNAYRYARGGAVTFSVDPDASMFRVMVTDQGVGIPHLETVLGGSYRSATGLGMGILGTRRLMDDFSIDSTRLGTTVQFGKALPAQSANIDQNAIQKLIAHVGRQHPATPIDELQTQNRELLKTLNELKERKEELVEMNNELQDTNRGVVALYAELDERADYLRRASELKSSFLSNMSHEFRTPLNSMLALTRMLLDRMDGELSAEQEQQVRFIQRSAHELTEMVDDLLDLAKVEAGRLDVKPRSFLVGDLFGALRGMLKPLLAESSLNLVFESPETSEDVFTDEQKVSQILRNFISNAIKFTPRGEVRVRAEDIGVNIRFSVSDTGIGIAESDQSIIFEEFAQVENSLQRKVKGTGLGLPLSRKLAELLGGQVYVQSAVGLGSTFVLEIPKRIAGAEAPTDLVLPEFDPAAKIALIVEDNRETAFIYERYLGSAGFASHHVASIQKAREFIAKKKPHIIILDLLLQGETTWDLLRDFNRAQSGIPILVISVSDDERRVYGLGADAYLRKPLSPDELVSTAIRLTSPLERRRVLLIDDNEVSRYLLREHIPNAEYEVFEARDGREGLRMAEDLRPAIIFLDFYMPDLTGLEVLKAVRDSDTLKQTAVVLHSTKVLEGGELEFFVVNATTIFPKQSLALPDAAARVRGLLDLVISHAAGGEQHG